MESVLVNAGTNKAQGGCTTGDCQPLHLRRKSQQVPASLAHTLGLVNASPLKTVSVPFELLIFTLAPGLSESVHKPFKFSISYGLVVLLEISPIGFQGQMLWGLLFPL